MTLKKSLLGTMVLAWGVYGAGVSSVVTTVEVFRTPESVGTWNRCLQGHGHQG